MLKSRVVFEMDVVMGSVEDRERLAVPIDGDRRSSSCRLSIYHPASLCYRSFRPLATGQCPPYSALRKQIQPFANHSLGVNFFPPSKKHVPLEFVARKIQKFAHQLFADPATTEDRG